MQRQCNHNPIQTNTPPHPSHSRDFDQSPVELSRKAVYNHPTPPLEDGEIKVDDDPMELEPDQYHSYGATTAYVFPSLFIASDSDTSRHVRHVSRQDDTSFWSPKQYPQHSQQQQQQHQHSQRNLHHVQQPQLRLADMRRTSQSSSSGTTPGGTSGKFGCSICNKKYTHRNCLYKHVWEHHEHWEQCLKFNLTKHQQVQMMEAAEILVAIGVGH